MATLSIIKMERRYYVCEFRLDSKNCFFIWIRDETDGVVLDESNKLQIFNSLEEAMQCPVEPKPISESSFYDFNRLEEWLANPKKKNLDCELVLNFWNLFGDIANSTEDKSFDQATKDTIKIYEKLFYGNNLSVITPKGKHYEPEWSKKEIKKISSILFVGLDLFSQKANINIQQPSSSS